MGKPRSWPGVPLLGLPHPPAQEPLSTSLAEAAPRSENPRQGFRFPPSPPAWGRSSSLSLCWPHSSLWHFSHSRDRPGLRSSARSLSRGPRWSSKVPPVPHKWGWLCRAPGSHLHPRAGQENWCEPGLAAPRLPRQLPWLQGQGDSNFWKLPAVLAVAVGWTSTLAVAV